MTIGTCTPHGLPVNWRAPSEDRKEGWDGTPPGGCLFHARSGLACDGEVVLHDGRRLGWGGTLAAWLAAVVGFAASPSRDDFRLQA